MLAREMLHFCFVCVQALYLFAPLLFSALLAGIVYRFDLVPWLAAPIDGGHTFGGRRIFGDGKTWRGVAIAIVGSSAAVSIQRVIPVAWVAAIAVVDYAQANPVLMGAAMGAGAMLGELPNSFLKRRLGIERGKTARGAWGVVFYVFDQIDLLLGAWPLVSPWVRPSLGLVVASVVVTLALHPTIALLGYLMGARISAR